MLVLGCEIVIEGKRNVRYRGVNSLEVNTSVRNLTDTARIVLPRKTVEKSRGNVSDDSKYIDVSEIISKGDRCSIKTWYKGYEDHFMTYEGYVTSVSDETPVVITAENEMWQLKKTVVSPKRYEKFDFKEFMQEYCPDVELVMPNSISFGEVIIKDETTVAKVIDYLQKNYPFNAYFDGKRMIVLLLTTLVSDTKKVTFKRGINVISSSLKYTVAEDVKVQIIAKSILADNTKLEAKSPADGTDCEVRTFYEPSCKTLSKLQEFADNKLLTYKTDKMTGDIVAFGIPFVKKGDTVIIKDDNSKYNNKKFIADAVKYTYGMGGYRQTITLGDEIK